MFMTCIGCELVFLEGCGNSICFSLIWHCHLNCFISFVTKTFTISFHMKSEHFPEILGAFILISTSISCTHWKCQWKIVEPNRLHLSNIPKIQKYTEKWKLPSIIKGTTKCVYLFQNVFDGEFGCAFNLIPRNESSFLSHSKWCVKIVLLYQPVNHMRFALIFYFCSFSFRLNEM